MEAWIRTVRAAVVTSVVLWFTAAMFAGAALPLALLTGASGGLFTTLVCGTCTNQKNSPVTPFAWLMRLFFTLLATGGMLGVVNSI